MKICSIDAAAGVRRVISNSERRRSAIYTSQLSVQYDYQPLTRPLTRSDRLINGRWLTDCTCTIMLIITPQRHEYLNFRRPLYPLVVARRSSHRHVWLCRGTTAFIMLLYQILHGEHALRTPPTNKSSPRSKDGHWTTGQQHEHSTK